MSEKLCANCFNPFDSILVVREIVVDNNEDGNWDYVKVKKVLSCIFNLDYLTKLPQSSPEDDDDPQEIHICGKCADVLTNLYKFHQDFRKLCHENSYVAKKTTKLNNIIDSMQSTTINQDNLSQVVIHTQTEIKPPSQETIQDSIAIEEVKVEPDVDTFENYVKEGSPSAEGGDSDSNYFDGECSMSMDEVMEENPQDDDDPLAVDEEEDETRSCPLCSNFYVGAGDLSSHLFRDHCEPGSTTCPVPSCQKSMNHRKNLKPHLDTHCGQKRHPCPVKSCPLTFANVNGARRHYRRHTEVTKTIAKSTSIFCPICRLLQSNPMKGAEHLLRFHTQLNSLTCPVCEVTSTSRGNLSLHLLSHTKR